MMTNTASLATLASNIARVCAHWNACEKDADRQVDELLVAVTREWRVMVKDVRWSAFGGVDTPARRAAYVARRVGDTRRRLTAYLHRPDCLALAEALGAVAIEATP
jgi:hypothetical protein